MPFFKRRGHEGPQPNLHGIPQVQPHLQPQMPLQPQLPLQSQQPGITQHQLSELQDLHLRMQKLQMQMDQLTSSVQARRASAPTADSHSHGEAAPANPSESSGPGPCPFPPYPSVPRFEELDETESRTSVPAGSSPSSRPQRSPSARGQSNQEVDLEQLLREGNRARAHSASSATGEMPPNHYQAQAYPANMNAFSSPRAPSVAQHGIPRSFGCEASYGLPTASVAAGQQAGTTFHGMPAMSPAAFAGGSSSGVFGNEYSPMQGMPMASESLPSTAGSHLPQTAGIHGLASQVSPSHDRPASCYQFPNPFNLAQGPHMPGFGNGFSMQQVPSVLGQIGAQFQAPRPMHDMGRPASPRPAFGF